MRSAIFVLITGLWVALSSCNSKSSSSVRTGSGGSAGEAGEGSGAAGSGGAGGSSTGGSGGGGTGGGAGAGCEMLPDVIDEELTVGPGCVILDRTRISTDGTLTIEPGTTVEVEAEGYLDVSGTLSAVGTEDDAILFTSANDDPLAGDWQCIRLAAGSSASDLNYVTLEYGGQPCEATGADYEATLDLASAVRRVQNVSITDSQTHAVQLHSNANVRGFSDNHFARNGAASILVSASEIISLGAPNTFDDEDDYIEVDTTFSLGTSGTWRTQAVPFRIVGGMQINDMAEVTMEAGLTLRMTGSSFEVFNANLNVEGTEEAPVTFTSAVNNPLAGDWGCILLSATTGTPSFDYAVIEYAGSGAGCTGANYTTALAALTGTRITNTVFREVAGSAIRIAQDCNTAWCDNTFEEVREGPLDCNLGTLMSCP